jgi:dipeptidyl aminopeptidase/acylaminoacyl peptidase
MNQPQIAPYGSWDSPITSDLIAAGTVNLGQMVLDEETIYWSEGRPSEDGRNVIVKWTPDGVIEDVTPAGFDVRTRVHEYGGGAFTVHNDTIYFSNFADQRLYRQSLHEEPEAITPVAPYRYADGIVDARRGRLICVREDHTLAQREAVNTLVSLDLGGDDEGGRVLVSGNDFYASPRLSPDGRQLAWLTWNHPNMPWDGTQLWLADVNAEGWLENERQVAGGIDESIFQPAWSPDGVLHFVSDRSGWWNLYRWHENQVEGLYTMEAEFGRPQWKFGLTTYDFEAADSIICTYTQGGLWHLARLNTGTGDLTPIETPYSTIAESSRLLVAAGYAVFNGSAASEPSAIVRLDLHTYEIEVVRRSTNITVAPGFLSIPQTIEFPTENGLTAHAFFYPPKNQDYAAPAAEQPPLLVVSHGGPTSATTTAFKPEFQYWTSRGFGILDVNYGGSTGYGRAYRGRLKGEWGIIDVNDCINGARYLVEQGQVDGDRLSIRGGSAGGYTTLCALTFHNFFNAGASYFGVSDVEALTKETHKFESRYLDGLIGPYPEKRDLYVNRSPIHFVEGMSAPLILFQGLEDKVVPPNQAQTMFDAMRNKGIPVAYLAFEGEQHGFRRAENIKRTLDAELYFYSQVFDFELPTPLEPVPIENSP